MKYTETKHILSWKRLGIRRQFLSVFIRKQVQFHVTATTLRLLEVAESTLMRRRDVKGKVRVFSIADGDQFLPRGDGDVDDVTPPRKLFTAAEKQRFATIAMDGVRITPEDVASGLSEFPGTSIRASEGMPIVQTLRLHGVIRQLFYLHNPEKTKALFSSCARFAWFWRDGPCSSIFLEFV